MNIREVKHKIGPPESRAEPFFLTQFFESAAECGCITFFTLKAGTGTNTPFLERGFATCRCDRHRTECAPGGNVTQQITEHLIIAADVDEIQIIQMFQM